MKQRIQFLLKHIELAPRVMQRTEMELYESHRVFFDARYEIEADEIMKDFYIFQRTGAFHFALTELYKFGHSINFPGLSVKTDWHRCAYWMLRASSTGSTKAFIFLSRMAPEYFVSETPISQLVDIVKTALIEQARLVQTSETMWERKKQEIVDDFIIDILTIPQECFDLEAVLNAALCTLKSIEKQREAHESTIQSRI